MSETEFNANLRDIQFVLFEQLHVEELCKLAPFKDFGKADFQLVLSEAARFAKEVLGPANRPADAVGCSYEKPAQAGGVPVVKTPPALREAWQQFRQAGWICMNGGQEHGGQGLPTTVAALAGELFTGSCCALALCSLLTQGVIHVLEKFGADELKAVILPKLFSGEWTGTMVLTEAQAGSDVGASKTRAKKTDDGNYLISGEKIFITCGDHDLADNIVHLVLARVEGALAGTKGLSLFVVPKFRVNADGSLGAFNDVRCSGIEHKMGINGSPTCTMSFGEDGDCRGTLLGREGDGIRIMFHMMNEARIDCGFQGQSQASAAYLNALDYARQRVQGSSIKDGKDPNAPKVTIDQHPDVRRMLISMKAYAEGLRALLASMARLVDLSQHAATPEEREAAGARLELLTPIGKAHGSDMGFQACHTAVQVFGGYGYLRDYPVEQYLRDVRISSIYEGANGIQAMDLLGRKLPMAGGKVFQAWAEEVVATARELADDERMGAAARKLIEATTALGKAAAYLGGIARQRVEVAFLHASPFLAVMGDVAIAHQLLVQAGIAKPKLFAIVGTPSAEAIANSPEATFYAGKAECARWFCANVLPQRIAQAEAICTGDTSPLEIVF
jgi:alkylation response protein AidB-like acyl-CoA dehydrogenase